MTRENLAIERVTVFGGSGFLGRQIVKQLADHGLQVLVAVRHPERAAFVQRYGDEGRIELARADVAEEASVARAVIGSHAVINAVGHYVEKGRATFELIHGQGAGHVARQAQEAGVRRLLHLSGMGADLGAKSSYIRARGVGETQVKKAFHDATIFRPSAIFGPDDALLTTLVRLARSTPALPLFGIGNTRLQPVFVGDVAKACLNALGDISTAGRLYELGGPGVFTYRELVDLVRRHVGKKTLLVPVPFILWDALAGLLGFLPDPSLTRDQVALMREDKVVTTQARGLEALGIAPTSIEEILPLCIGSKD